MDLVSKLPRTLSLVVVLLFFSFTLLLLTPAANDAAGFGGLLAFTQLSSLLGFGLGIDVMGATAAMFMLWRRSDSIDKWAQRNTLTHTFLTFGGIVLVTFLARNGGTLLAIVGFVASSGFAIAGRYCNNEDRWKWGCFAAAGFAIAGITGNFVAVLGLIGFILLMQLLYFEVYLGVFEEEEDEEDDNPENWRNVIAVSMDCPMSSMAKSGFVDGWSWWSILASSPIKGVTVGIMALAGVALALGMQRVLREATAQSIEGAAWAGVIPWYFEWVVLGFFAWRSLFNSFLGLEWTNGQCILFSFVVSTLLWGVSLTKVLEVQRRVAIKRIQTNTGLANVV